MKAAQFIDYALRIRWVISIRITENQIRLFIRIILATLIQSAHVCGFLICQTLCRIRWLNANRYARAVGLNIHQRVYRAPFGVLKHPRELLGLWQSKGADIAVTAITSCKPGVNVVKPLYINNRAADS